MDSQHARYVNNMLDVWDSATAAERASGAAWYPTALGRCQTIAGQFGMPTAAVVRSLAALSPLREWELNVRQTKEVVKAYKAKRKAPAVHFRARISAALACLRGEPVTGAKVSAFAAAILGDTTAAVIDTWMLRAMDYQKPHFPKGPQYTRLAECLTLAAREAGVPTSTFQATVWTVIRDRK